MTGPLIDYTLSEVKRGDDLARERIIHKYKPYIQNVASNICSRYISWSDEEASIALIAFNKAIETFDATGGRSFQSYAFLLIKRDLIDFFRKEKREIHLSMNLDEEDHSIENDKSMELYEQSVQSTNLVDEILELDERLGLYNISFEELEDFCPKHRDTRESLFVLADQFITDQECVDNFITKRQLPVSLFANKSGFKKKTLERHRKYIITLILIKLNPEWVQLSQYIVSK